MVEPVDVPTPVYIVGPFAGAHWYEVMANVDRAKRLARWLSRRGYAVVCVHPVIDEAADADPVLRSQGLAQSLDLVRMVARAGGRLAIIEREDGTLSQGSALEVDAWREVADLRGRSWRAGWVEWDAMIRGVPRG